MPASFWNISTGEGPLVDSLSGRILEYGVVNLGQETVRAGGRDIVATRYRLQAKRPRSAARLTMGLGMAHHWCAGRHPDKRRIHASTRGCWGTTRLYLVEVELIGQTVSVARESLPE